MMQAQTSTDVVVIGAGPVGLTLVNLLADLGVRTLLVERAETISDEPRAISITDESLRVMQQLGIMEQLKPEMLMNTGARYFGRKGQLLAEVRPRQYRLGQPAKSQFDQPILAQLLLNATQQRALASVRFKTEARHIESDGECACVELFGERGSELVHCQWVIACDGGRSPARTQLAIPLEGSTQVERWIVIDVLNSTHSPEPFSQFHCNGQRPCVVVPGVHGRCRYEFMVLAQDDLDTILQADSVIKLVAPYQTIEAKDIRRAAVYAAQQRIAKTYRKGRILLAGDAAHLMPPFAGQGLNSGVRDAANIAWKIAACVRDNGSAALLDSYEQERRPHAAQMVSLSWRIGQVVMSTSPVLTPLRDWSISALGLVPSAKAWIVGMKFLRQPHFVQGCIQQPSDKLSPQIAELVGKAIAQPKVRAAHGEMYWLDELLGPSWAVVYFRPDGKIQIASSSDPEWEQKFFALQDGDELFKEVAGSGAAVLVRPDRYVAAAVASLEDLPGVVSHFKHLLPHLGDALGISKHPPQERKHQILVALP